MVPGGESFPLAFKGKLLCELYQDERKKEVEEKGGKKKRQNKSKCHSEIHILRYSNCLRYKTNGPPQDSWDGPFVLYLIIIKSKTSVKIMERLFVWLHLVTCLNFVDTFLWQLVLVQVFGLYDFHKLQDELKPEQIGILHVNSIMYLGMFV